MSAAFTYNDGGRAETGRKGHTGDCVTRAIAIAAEVLYQQVYDALAAGNAAELRTKRGGRSSGRRTASQGIHTTRQWFKDYMRGLGFTWHPTMQIGSGCKVHLKAEELPKGRIIAAVSRHYCAVIDGVINDIFDPSRDGTRCVYGYWAKERWL